MMIKEAMEKGLPIELFRSHTNYEYSTITLEHEGKFIKAHKDTDNYVDYWYDLQEETFIAHYSTTRPDRKVETENITRWFTECKIITQDYKFAKLILFNTTQNEFMLFSNPARFIQGLSNPKCARYEQWDALGIKIEEAEDLLNNPNIGKTLSRRWYDRERISTINKAPNQVNKEMLKMICENYETISVSELNSLCNQYDFTPEKYKVLMKLEEYEEEYPDLFIIEEYSYSKRRFKTENIIKTNSYQRRHLINTIIEYNLDIDRFVKYLYKLKNYEHTEIDWVCRNYSDYLRAEKTLRGGKLSKMDKYPSNLVQMHHNTTQILANLEKEKLKIQNEMEKAKEKELYAEHSHLSYNPPMEDYCIIVPEDSDDIINEGMNMNHCVGSYVGRIRDGETFIVFMRRKGNKDKSYVTVEIRKGRVFMALGKNNRGLMDDEKRFLKKYSEAKGLKYEAYI